MASAHSSRTDRFLLIAKRSDVGQSSLSHSFPRALQALSFDANSSLLVNCCREFGPVGEKRGEMFSGFQLVFSYGLLTWQLLSKGFGLSGPRSRARGGCGRGVPRHSGCRSATFSRGFLANVDRGRPGKGLISSGVAILICSPLL
jgi:hypothetical protein